MRFAQQVGAHGLVLRMDAKVSVAQFSEAGGWARVPTGPRERRIAVGILCVDDRAGILQQADGFHFAKCCGAVERRLALGSAVAHEAPVYTPDTVATLGLAPCERSTMRTRS